MPTTDRDLYRKAIRRTLAQRAGDASDASAVAEATFIIWHEVAARIIPVIGVGGADILFNRSLHLTCTAFPWLTIVGDHRDSAALLANIKARLAGSETETATEASYALLVTFVELLSTLIGESLTGRLLSPVWADQQKPSYQESTS